MIFFNHEFRTVYRDPSGFQLSIGLFKFIFSKTRVFVIDSSEINGLGNLIVRTILPKNVEDYTDNEFFTFINEYKDAIELSIVQKKYY